MLRLRLHLPLRRHSVIAVAAGMAVWAAATAGPVAAADPTLRIDPGTQTVAQGSTFTVHVVQNYADASLGAQVTIAFDQTKLQIQKVVRGAPFANAPIVAPADMGAAITAANGSGKLAQVMAAFIPPNSDAAGDEDFLDVTFKANGCGQTPLSVPIGPTDGLILDGSGGTLTIKTIGAEVTINNCGGDGGGGGGGDTSQPTSPPDSAATQSAAGATQDTSSQSTPGTGDVAATPSTGSTPDNGAVVSATQSTGTGNGAGGGSNSTSGSGGSGNTTTLPAWLPILLAIPAVAVIWLGLRKWRLQEIS